MVHYIKAANEKPCDCDVLFVILELF